MADKFRFVGTMYKDKTPVGYMNSSGGAYATADQHGTTLSLEYDNDGSYLTNVDSDGRYLGQDGDGARSAQWNLGGGTWTYLKWDPDDGRIEAVEKGGKTKGLYLARGDGSNVIWSKNDQLWIKWAKASLK
jgi:hypothetical protein